MKTIQMPDRGRPVKTAGPLLGIFLLVVPLAVQASAPTIKLFPTTVLEEIKHTGNVAAEMETGLQSVIARLDEQQKLYIESKCEGNEGDPGCEQIARQMGKSYLEMLNIMGEKLPEMETAVNSTSASLKKRIRRELGQKNTSWTLQELLVGAQTDAANKENRPTLRGRSGMRLSDRFHQYYRLVARSGGDRHPSLVLHLRLWQVPHHPSLFGEQQVLAQARPMCKRGPRCGSCSSLGGPTRLPAGGA